MDSSSFETMEMPSLQTVLRASYHCPIIMCVICTRAEKVCNTIKETSVLMTRIGNFDTCRLDGQQRVPVGNHSSIPVRVTYLVKRTVQPERCVCVPQCSTTLAAFTAVYVIIVLQVLKQIALVMKRGSETDGCRRRCGVMACRQKKRSRNRSTQTSVAANQSQAQTSVLQQHELNIDSRGTDSLIENEEGWNTLEQTPQCPVQESSAPAPSCNPFTNQTFTESPKQESDNQERYQHKANENGISEVTETDMLIGENSHDETSVDTATDQRDWLQHSQYLTVKELPKKRTTPKEESKSRISRLFFEKCLQYARAPQRSLLQKKLKLKSDDTDEVEGQIPDSNTILKELKSAPTMRFAPQVQRAVTSYMCNKSTAESGIGRPFNAERDRLASFDTLGKIPATWRVWLTRIAAAGFYCLDKESSTIKCAFCELRIEMKDFQNKDPMDLHKNKSPDCPFVKGQSSNVTLQLQGQIAGLNVIHGFFGDTSPLDQEHSSRGVKDQHKDTPISEQAQRRRECLQSSARGHSSGGGAARIQSSSAPCVTSTSLLALPTNPSPRGVSSQSPRASMPAQSSHRSRTPVNSLPRWESNAAGRTAGAETAPTGHHAQSSHRSRTPVNSLPREESNATSRTAGVETASTGHHAQSSSHSPDPNVTAGHAGVETARREPLAQAASSHAQGSVTPTQLTESARSRNTHVTQSSPSSGPIRSPATESALPFQTAQPISTHQQETSSSSQTSSASASPQASTNSSASQSNPREAVAHPDPAPQAPPPSSTGEPERQVVTYSQLGIYTQEPKRSDFAIAATRAGSFTAWPHPDTHSPQDMAEAGFYYVGQDDLVRCFYCKGGLKSWAPHLRPWVEHARFFPKCPFVGQVKGQDFVDVVQELKERQDTISAEQVEEELTARQRDTQALSTLPPPEGAVGGVSAAVGGADENTDVTQLAKVADEGKCPAYRLDIVGICKKQCTCDQDCKGEEKCCFNGCVNRCFRPILPTIVTCATMTCDAGYTCTDYPSGGACEPIEKAGTCPALPCRRPRRVCKGGKKAECSMDTDCQKKNDKCCTGCDGCVRCVGRAAPSSCDNMFCAMTTACVKDRNGPKCVKDMPKYVPSNDVPDTQCGNHAFKDKESGHCPLSTCSSPGDLDLLVCKDKKACVSDVQCDDNKKCCKDCRGCGVCVEPPTPPSCSNKKCKTGEVCSLEWVPCKTPPCPLAPKCDKPCMLPKEEGVCVDKIKSWYFDLATRSCVKFTYGGCEGNNNRFSSKAECAKACIKNVKCPDGGPKPPCLNVNECALSAKGNKPLCPTGKACCPTKCGTRCFKPVY